MTPNINPHPYPIATSFHPNPSSNNVESSPAIRFDGGNGALVAEHIRRQIDMKYIEGMVGLLF